MKNMPKTTPTAKINPPIGVFKAAFFLDPLFFVELARYEILLDLATANTIRLDAD